MNAEPYIPLRISDLVDILLTEAGTPEHPPFDRSQHAAFRALAAALTLRLDANYRGLHQTLKDAYDIFDPDVETLRLGDIDDSDYRQRLDRLFTSVTVLLERGGFHRMTREEIELTMQGSSYWGIEMDVCWEVFDRVEVFYRGRGLGWRQRRPWWKLFHPQDVEVPTFRRVVLILKQQPHRRLGPHADTLHVFMKIFKDIPQMDVEMLLPGTRLRMPKMERGKLGGVALGSLAWLIFKIIPMIGSNILTGGILALLSPLFLILGYGYKTIVSFRVSQRSYMLQLTQSLYYQNLDSNAGVLHRLFDEAAEQDVRQTLLAYYFLLRFAGAAGWTPDELDKAVESDLERRVGRPVEVDTNEALARLLRLKMIQRVGERHVAFPLAQAIGAVESNTPQTKAESEWRSALPS